MQPQRPIALFPSWFSRPLQQLRFGNPAEPLAVIPITRFVSLPEALPAARHYGGRTHGATSDQINFVYTTYIHRTPEQVWRGLTDPAFTSGWWRHHKAGGRTSPSDWKTGSTYAMIHGGIGLVVGDPAQVIAESEPYRRLAFTWHTFTPEWARGVGMDEATVTAWRASPVDGRLDIEPDDNGVAGLTVIHGNSDLAVASWKAFPPGGPPSWQA